MIGQYSSGSSLQDLNVDLYHEL